MKIEDIKISEAFEHYRLDQIVYNNESDRTEEMHNLALKCFIDFAGDLPVSKVIFDVVRKWKDHLSRDKKPNTVRGYIIKLRVVMKYLQYNGYPVINHQLIGIPKRDTVVVDFLKISEIHQAMALVFAHLLHKWSSKIAPRRLESISRFIRILCATRSRRIYSETIRI